MSEETKEVVKVTKDESTPGFFASIPWSQMLVSLITFLVLDGLIWLFMYTMTWADVRMGMPKSSFGSGVIVFFQVLSSLLLVVLSLVVLNVVAIVLGEASDKRGKPCALKPLPGFFYVLILAAIGFQMAWFLFGTRGSIPCDQYRILFKGLFGNGVGATIVAIVHTLLTIPILVSVISPLALYIRSAVKRLKAAK